MKRIEILRQSCLDKGFDGFLVANEINILYFSGAPGASCLLVPDGGESILYVYGVNYEQVKAEAKGFRVELVKREENLMAKVAEHVRALGIRRLAFDTLNVESYRAISRKLRGAAKLKPQGSIVWSLRRIKDMDELELMRRAAELACEGMKTAQEVLRPGMMEYEVAAEIEYAMRNKGSWGTAFETIVASGARSAYPHGGCVDRKIQAGDLVVIDIGASYRHYRSDMTRTFVAGEPSSKQKQLYELVKLAQEKAIKAIKPGVKAGDVDAAARSVIEKAGYGENFVHGLGHGVGLEVHEPPTISPQSMDKLESGNVVTIEPGIYLVGFGGIRIEDMVLVGEFNAEKLTDDFYGLEA
ncbi:MAG: Xaa-Pro peptidase family protein [Candidatus Bathyarchaeota archaeon]|nr:Xaa-Pro peptidase family protein [Candidatus Bathyarchaeota archaeon]